MATGTQQEPEDPRERSGSLRDFLRETRIWWLTPLVVGIVLVVLLVLATDSAVSPFVYSLF